MRNGRIGLLSALLFLNPVISMLTTDTTSFFILGADAILLIHVLFVVFVVMGLVVILLGKVLSWSWVRNPWFRWAHLLAIGVVVLQSWLGVICPLTKFEMALRARGGAEEGIYSGSFVTHWLESILYFRAPPWVFVLGYTAFGVLVLASWFRVVPRRSRRVRSCTSSAIPWVCDMVAAMI